MRKIKFRGKRLDNDIQTGPADGWVTGFYYQGLCEGEVRHFIASCPCVWEVDPATVGQYTGLKDKNGEEICEGDIVEWENMMGTKMCSVIAYRGRGFCFVDAHNKPEEIWCYVFKKIGNIHDNPELLKGGER